MFCFILVVSSQSIVIQGQTEQQASDAILEADNRLIYALELIEDIPNYDENIRGLIQQIDNARQLIKEAKDQFADNNFTVSYQKATEATLELDAIIDEIENKMLVQSRNKVLVFSFVGVFSAIGAILFSILFIRKIYPWYEKKKIEEYGKLEIKYDESRGDSK
jgi:hypothetical protein